MISSPVWAKIDSTLVGGSLPSILRDSSLANLASKWKSGSLKVVHLGDSHIQIGHFSSEVKRLLGINKLGIQFPYSLAKSVDGRILKTKASGLWTGFSVLQPASGKNIGLVGYAVSTRDTTAQIQFTAKDTLVQLGRVRVWFESDACSMEPELGPGFTPILRRQQGKMVYVEFEATHPMNHFSLALRKSKALQDVFTLHGIELLSEGVGMEYHDLGVAGAQFTQLTSRGTLVLDQIQLLQPDLIICSFGTNEAYNANWNPIVHKQALLQWMQEIKVISPQAAFLFTSPPDTRSQKRIPQNQLEVIRVLSEMPAPFYDLNAAMGGFGSSLDWIKRGLLLKDQLHFNREGYQQQAALFVLALFKSWGAVDAFENLLNQYKISVGIPK